MLKKNNFREKLLTKTALLCILILAGFLRINNLQNNPPGFYTDEASIGYNAYKIATTARDEHGKFLPIFFEAFGEYKNPFAIYPVVPFITLFGVNEFAVRLTQAVWGLLNIIAIYFLAKELWNKNIGLLGAFTLAIIPWHVHLSRFIIESHNAFLFFILTGTLFLTKALKDKKQTKYIILTALCFGLSFYTYFATRIFTPLFLISLAFFLRKDLLALLKSQTKKCALALAIFGIIILPFVFHMTSGEGLVRFSQVSTKKSEGKENGLIKKTVMLYKDHLAPKFVFITGESDFPGQELLRHSVPGIGLLYKWQLPFFLLGICALFLTMRGKPKNYNKVIILSMLLLYPTGTLITDATTPFATRSVVGVVPYSLLVALGIQKTLVFLKNRSKLLLVLFLSLVVFTTGFYLKRFIDLSNVYMNRAYGYTGFQYGTKQVADYFLKHQDNYEIMILFYGLDGPQAYLNFYSRGACQNCKANDPQPKNQQIIKLIAVPIYALGDFNAHYDLQALKETIYYPIGEKAFYIFEAKSK